jgi:hypothetical protein
MTAYDDIVGKNVQIDFMQNPKFISDCRSYKRSCTLQVLEMSDGLLLIKCVEVDITAWVPLSNISALYT